MRLLRTAIQADKSALRVRTTTPTQSEPDAKVCGPFRLARLARSVQHLEEASHLTLGVIVSRLLSRDDSGGDDFTGFLDLPESGQDLGALKPGSHMIGMLFVNDGELGGRRFFFALASERHRQGIFQKDVVGTVHKHLLKLFSAGHRSSLNLAFV